MLDNVANIKAYWIMMGMPMAQVALHFGANDVQGTVVREQIFQAAGATAGTEQKGPHMVDGEHKFVMEYTADKIARALGKTLVAPIVTYVPEGSWENPGGHMAKPGTITLPEDRFVELLVHAGRSLKSGGFTTILFLGESGGNRSGMRTAALRLNEMWKGAAKAYWVDDYYTKAHRDQEVLAAKFLGVAENQVGNHANILDTSELLFVAPQHVRALFRKE